MAINDVVNKDGSLNFNTIGGFKDRLDGHDSQFTNTAAQLATSTQIKGTTQNITFNNDGTVQMVQHLDTNSNVLRQDVFTYSTNLITEVRTVGNYTLTFKYHLDTLQTEVI